MNRIDAVHARSTEEVIRALETDAERGLSSSEAAARLAQFGRNRLPDEKRRSLLVVFFRQFTGALRLILLFAAGLSFSLGETADGIGILIAVAIDVVFGLVQERRAEFAIAKLRSLIVQEATVVRDGRVHRIPAETLVPGDVMRIAEGDHIAADARLIDVKDLSVAEAALTGESMPVRKQVAAVDGGSAVADRTDMVWAGTAATAGTARAIVVETGVRTEFGKIAQSLQRISRGRTPFEQRVDSLGRNLGVLAVVLSIVVLAGGMLRGFPLDEMFFLAVAMMVSVIPEGLPAVLAVVLAIGVQRMAKRNAIVRHVPSVETLGVCDVICTDKTGTLTENKMTVREVATAEFDIQVGGEGWDMEGAFSVAGRAIRPTDVHALDRLLRAVGLCSDAVVELRDGRVEVIGDPTEAALSVLAEKAGFGKDELDKEYERIDEIPFSSSRKYRAVCVERTDVGGRRTKHLFVVGAYDVLASRIAAVVTDGGATPFDDGRRARFEAANERMARQVMRVLCVAHRDLPPDKDGIDESDVRDLSLMGLTGMIDPPREGVDRAIAQCRRAGIRVIMITGDQLPTAVAIGRQIGLLDGASAVAMEQDIAGLDDAALRDRVKDAAVFARVTPATKLRIVTALQELGHTVAMTGDGVNDAPALKKASIGVSMGITGTDVSKEVADMVLADDNFVSIVNAVEEGRTVFQNVKNTTAFLFMTNIGEVLTVLAALAIGLPLPLLPTQILWMNLVTDGFPDVALATEPSDEDVLTMPPRAKDEPIITRNVLSLTIITASLMCAGTLALFWWELHHGTLAHARTIAFTTMAMFQLWNVFNLRSLRRSLFSLGIFSNPWVTWGVLVSMGMQLAVLYLPSLQGVFQTVPLGLFDWTVIIAVTSSMLFVVELYKYALRRTRMAAAR